MPAMRQPANSFGNRLTKRFQKPRRKPPPPPPPPRDDDDEEDDDDREDYINCGYEPEDLYQNQDALQMK